MGDVSRVIKMGLTLDFSNCKTKEDVEQVYKSRDAELQALKKVSEILK